MEFIVNTKLNKKKKEEKKSNNLNNGRYFNLNY